MQKHFEMTHTHRRNSCYIQLYILDQLLLESHILDQKAKQTATNTASSRTYHNIVLKLPFCSIC